MIEDIYTGYYGVIPGNRYRLDLFFTKETPIHTSSPYSSSKAGADLLVMAYQRTFDIGGHNEMKKGEGSPALPVRNCTANRGI